jgi:hypothetical protein
VLLSVSQRIPVVSRSLLEEEGIDIPADLSAEVVGRQFYSYVVATVSAMQRRVEQWSLRAADADSYIPVSSAGSASATSTATTPLLLSHCC